MEDEEKCRKEKRTFFWGRAKESVAKFFRTINDENDSEEQQRLLDKSEEILEVKTSDGHVDEFSVIADEVVQVQDGGGASKTNRTACVRDFESDYSRSNSDVIGSTEQLAGLNVSEVERWIKDELGRCSSASGGVPDHDGINDEVFTEGLCSGTASPDDKDDTRVSRELISFGDDKTVSGEYEGDAKYFASSVQTVIGAETEVAVLNGEEEEPHNKFLLNAKTRNERIVGSHQQAIEVRSVSDSDNIHLREIIEGGCREVVSDLVADDISDEFILTSMEHTTLETDKSFGDCSGQTVQSAGVSSGNAHASSAYEHMSESSDVAHGDNFKNIDVEVLKLSDGFRVQMALELKSLPCKNMMGYIGKCIGEVMEKGEWNKAMIKGLNNCKDEHSQYQTGGKQVKTCKENGAEHILNSLVKHQKESTEKTKTNISEGEDVIVKVSWIGTGYGGGRKLDELLDDKCKEDIKMVGPCLEGNTTIDARSMIGNPIEFRRTPNYDQHNQGMNKSRDSTSKKLESCSVLEKDVTDKVSHGSESDEEERFFEAAALECETFEEYQRWKKIACGETDSGSEVGDVGEAAQDVIGDDEVFTGELEKEALCEKETSAKEGTCLVEKALVNEKATCDIVFIDESGERKTQGESCAPELQTDMTKMIKKDIKEPKEEQKLHLRIKEMVSQVFGPFRSTGQKTDKKGEGKRSRRHSEPTTISVSKGMDLKHRTDDLVIRENEETPVGNTTQDTEGLILETHVLAQESEEEVVVNATEETDSLILEADEEGSGIDLKIFEISPGGTWPKRRLKSTDSDETCASPVPLQISVSDYGDSTITSVPQELEIDNFSEELLADNSGLATESQNQTMVHSSIARGKSMKTEKWKEYAIEKLNLSKTVPMKEDERISADVKHTGSILGRAQDMLAQYQLKKLDAGLLGDKTRSSSLDRSKILSRINEDEVMNEEDEEEGDTEKSHADENIRESKFGSGSKSGQLYRTKSLDSSSFNKVKEFRQPNKVGKDASLGEESNANVISRRSKIQQKAGNLEVDDEGTSLLRSKSFDGATFLKKVNAEEGSYAARFIGGSYASSDDKGKVNKYDKIESVVDPWGMTLTLDEAVKKGIIDEERGLYINPITGKSMTIQGAVMKKIVTKRKFSFEEYRREMAERFARSRMYDSDDETFSPPTSPSSTNQSEFFHDDPPTSPPQSSLRRTKSTPPRPRPSGAVSNAYGLIHFNCQTSSVPLVCKSVTNTLVGTKMSLEVAKRFGIVDETSMTYLDKKRGRQMTFDEAVGEGLMEVEEGMAGVHPVIKSNVNRESFLIYGVMDKAQRKRVPFKEAVAKGIINEDGTFHDTVTNKSMPIYEAIEKKFLETKRLSGASLRLYDNMVDTTSVMELEKEGETHAYVGKSPRSGVIELTTGSLDMNI